MNEHTNKPSQNPDKKLKSLNLGEDFELWLKGRNEQKEFLVAKTHFDTQSQLDDMRESFGQKSFEKRYNLTETHTPQVVRQNNLGASFETIQTRQAGDGEKNVLQGIQELLYVPFRALKDTFIDAKSIAFSPIKETKRTIAVLKKENPNIEIV